MKLKAIVSIVILAGFLTGPLAAMAQETKKTPRIGILALGERDRKEWECRNKGAVCLNDIECPLMEYLLKLLF